MGVLQSVESKLGRNSKPVGNWLELQKDSSSSSGADLILFQPHSNYEEKQDLARVSIRKSTNNPNLANDLPSSLPFGIHLHKAVILNSKIYVFGGSTRKELNSNSFLEYNIESKKWKVLPSFIECREFENQLVGPSLLSSTNNQTNQLPTNSRIYLNPCFYHSVSACPKRNKIYVFGGRTSSVISSNNLYEFDVKTEEWTILNPVRISKKNIYSRERLPRREGHSSFIRKDCLYIIAGYEYNTDQYSNEIIEINLDSQTWKFLSEDMNIKPANPMLQVPSVLFSSASSLLSSTSNERVSSTAPQFTKLAYHTSVYCESKDELIIYAGKTREKPFGPLTNSLHIYSFQKKEWSAFSAPNLVKSGFISYDDNRQFIKSYNKGGNLFMDRYLIVSNGLINDHYDRRHYINEVMIIDIHTNQWYKISNSNLLNMYYDSFLIFSEKKCYSIGGYNPCVEKPHLDTLVELDLQICGEQELIGGMERFLDSNLPMKKIPVKSREGFVSLIPLILMKRLDESELMKEDQLKNGIEMETSVNCVELLKDWLVGKELNAELLDLIELFRATLQFKKLEQTLHPYLINRIRKSLISNKDNVEEELMLCESIPRLRPICEEVRNSTNDSQHASLVDFKFPLQDLLDYFSYLREEIKSGKRKGDLTLTLETNRNLKLSIDSEICIITSQFFSKLISGQFNERLSSKIILNNDITLNESDLNDLVDLLYLQPPSNLMKCTNRLEIINQIFVISDFYCIDWMTNSMNYLIL
ncbi:predicted protein [Naegleria gruberi]|uniref:Predicted protein n=1 Tax=Naegleria gruberi TaxID=5762 RepID=D2VSQ6_NAEGR|nr:uncharacterized protein NAEGRDRAFT_51960 [Naegleria gruberi]EFC40235.1 predicted protein [Naegleria gruberi]|eukprot:XP_002672979.1 predicted protein [Naegleria gruberi strain NEG-M]